MDHNKVWKLLKEMGIPDHLICLLRNLQTQMVCEDHSAGNHGFRLRWSYIVPLFIEIEQL